VSDFVRDDLLEHYGEKWAHKVVTLYNPVAWQRLVTTRPASTRAPYVLSVASHYRHKNLATLIRAFEHVHRVQPDVRLVLVGQLGANLVGVRRSEDVATLVASLGLADVVHVTGYVEPDQLGALYRDAALFVFPSIFEGFGLPPVEALGFGLPVITTRRASLPEVTRGLADYVEDPFDEGELASLVLQRLADGRRPSPSQVQEIRDFYSPRRIGGELYRLLTDVR
jgi:glycosyltransferase involved in cell wall biosynthesis